MDEIGYEPADVLVDTGSKIIEIEVKISKNDLWKGEAVKKKHRKCDISRECQQFFICVPKELKEEAYKWVKDTNEKYGIILFDTELLEEGYKYWKNYLIFEKRAKVLNKDYKKDYNGKLSLRLCSALVNMYERNIN